MDMVKIGKLVIKKLVLLFLLIIFISFISFLLVDISPIDPVNAYVRNLDTKINLENKNMLIEKYSLNKPFLTRYLYWLKNLLRLDLGESMIYQRPVIEVIKEGFFSSFFLIFISWIIQGVLGVLLGIISGVNSDKFIDRIIKSISIVISSTPTFWVAILMISIFAVKLKMFPIGFSVPVGVRESDVSILQKIHHLILPSLTLGIVGTSNITLHTRQKVIDILNSDFVIFSRSMGKSDIQTVKKYALKNILLPAITLEFTSFSELFSGIILAETIFNYKGLGSISVNAGLNADMALLLGITVFCSIFVYTGNQIADILYHIIDPRMMREAEIEK